ncbi:DUF2267 domain-containing protein [Salinimicrobium tongyeongense]|uniref:DUF2267 domain-containing protein n=1 Tax=Salinimicrobium tongyeongense TaxID=2809707 RepID=A0ABY6NQ90_9FLAO|nr:DUF2267 domain-containing protein [Salinimicrobium tongyeongense]UZH55070.1 DUF2267 domain-containing protein [Salinimicrobium tongyeongense]
MASHLSFDKFAKEAYDYVNDLARDLGHPEEKERVLIIWRAVMHALRDRIHMGEAMQLMDPLPTIFRGIYAENWKYNEKPPNTFSSIEEMKEEVKSLQAQYGEEDFPWKKPTEEIISITINSLDRFLQGKQLQHLKDQLPKEVKELAG